MLKVVCVLLIRRHQRCLYATDILPIAPKMRISIPKIDFVPSLPPALQVSVDEAAVRLARFLEDGQSRSHRPDSGNGTLILCGAGVSVDRCAYRTHGGGYSDRLVLFGLLATLNSGIRAYRGKGGSYNVNRTYRPIFFHEFVAHESYRQRYWARSYLGAISKDIIFDERRSNLVHRLSSSSKSKSQPDSFRHGCSPTPWLFETWHNHSKCRPVNRIHRLCSLRATNVFSSLQHKAIPTQEKALSTILELHGSLKHAHCLSMRDFLISHNNEI